MNTSIKAELYTYCQNHISEKINAIQKAIDDARAAANNESKSSAGDKHETARAMMHLEQEKNARQLQEMQKLQKVLHQISPDSINEKAALGSLIKTSSGYFYLAISIGKINFNNTAFFVISPVSPIGQQLLGKQVGDSIAFNGKKMVIEELF